MSIVEQIETIVKDLTNNNHPPQLVTITKAYNKPICDINTPNGDYKNIPCSGKAIQNTKGLLTYTNGEQDKPFVILFQDAETIIHSLGLGLFTIGTDGNLYIELPNGVENTFTINENGDLTTTEPNYNINNDGDATYDRWDI